MAPSSNKIHLGKWEFHEIRLEDMDMYAEFIKATEYPANLWSSNFAYLWATSRSRLRKVLWVVIDGLLVTFGHSYKNSLYLYCLPFGPGNPGKFTDVIFKCLKYCFEWNNQENHRTLVRMINHQQLEFLEKHPEFDSLFRRITLQGIERHLDVKKLVALRGKDFSDVRNKVNKFHRENPDAIIRPYQKKDYVELLELGERWGAGAGRRNVHIFDKAYYQEMLKHCDELKQMVMVVQKGHQIIGMVSGGALPTGQGWGSLLKYREGFPGLSETLSVEFARELFGRHPEIELLNVGSDLGAGGLRTYKLKFRPVLNLKRYQLYLN